MKQRNDKTNRKTTALAEAVAVTTIGLLTSFVLPRTAAAGAGRIPGRRAPVEAFGSVSAMAPKFASRAAQACARDRGGFVARPLQVNDQLCNDPMKVELSAGTASPGRLGLSL